jgi:hypothetical protein
LPKEVQESLSKNLNAAAPKQREAFSPSTPTLGPTDWLGVPSTAGCGTFRDMLKSSGFIPSKGKYGDEAQAREVPWGSSDAATPHRSGARHESTVTRLDRPGRHVELVHRCWR